MKEATGDWRGMVLRSTGSWYEVLDPEGESRTCKAAGRLRLNSERCTNPIAVGDEVEVEDGDRPVIIGIRARRNKMVRRSVNLSYESHVIAANLDRAFLIITIARPQTSTGFIDRFTVTARAYGVPVTLVLNKCDDWSEEEAEAAAELTEIYRNAGYSVLHISATEGIGQDKLRAALVLGNNLLSGHSGVGKSTLINALIPGLDLRTDEVSEAHNKGRHTTTFAEMHPLPDGGFIIDTPGVKGFGLVKLGRETLHHHFPEMFAMLPDCKFHNCLHRSEPGCMVREAVQDGFISVSRYTNYIEMYEQFEEDSSYR